MAHIPGTGLLPTGGPVNPALQGEFIPAQQPVPQFGLQGAEQALLTGGGIARQDVAPFAQAGVAASGQQAAFSGALGQEAQSQAFQNFQESPGQRFLRERQERALTRNAAATGGLGGGNLPTALQEQAVGFANQQFQQNFQNLGELSNRGLGAAQFGGQVAQNVGSQIGGFRSQAGRDIAGFTGQTTSALSRLAEGQGAGISDITGQTSNNLQGIIERAGQGSANDIQQLQALLANISQGAGSQVGGLGTPQQVLPPSLLGQIGQISSGVGGALSGFQ